MLGVFSPAAVFYSSHGKHKLLSLFLLLTLSLMLTACKADGEHPVIELPPEPENGVLIYAALNPVSSEVQISVDAFNLRHEDEKIRMEIRDYSDEGGVQRLLTELMLGRVPDIMELHRFGGSGEELVSNDLIDWFWEDRPADEYWMPYRQLAHKGYLENLWPYIESDPDLGRDGVMEPLLKAAEVNGGLYTLFRDAYILTLTGPERVVGAQYGWTFDELMEAFSSMPEDSTILRYNATKRDVFSQLIRFSLNQFVDWEAGRSSFDSAEFRSILEFLKSFPDETAEEELEQTTEELVWRVKNGRQMLEGFVVDHVGDIRFADALWGERSSFPGYPTADGSSGSFFYPRGGVLAMSSTCRNKDAAWDFMRKRIAPRYSFASAKRSVADNRILVNRNDYEQLQKAAFSSWEEHFAHIDLVKQPALSGHITLFSGEVAIYPKRLPNEEDIVRFESLISHTTQLYWPDDELSDIIWEACGPYFAGDRTLDETVRMIENRVGLYVNENR